MVNCLKTYALGNSKRQPDKSASLDATKLSIEKWSFGNCHLNVFFWLINLKRCVRCGLLHFSCQINFNPNWTCRDVVDVLVLSSFWAFLISAKNLLLRSSCSNVKLQSKPKEAANTASFVFQLQPHVLEVAASRQRVFPLVQLISAGGWLRLEIEILRL